VRSDVGAAAYLPMSVITHRGLTNGAVRLYALLAVWADGDGDPTREQMATAVGSSSESVDRWLHNLLTVGAISADGRRGHLKRYMVHLALPPQNTGSTVIDETGLNGESPVQPILEDIPEIRTIPPHTIEVNDQEPAHKTPELQGRITTAKSKRQKTHSSTVRTTSKFAQFYAAYPKHVCRVKAERAWLKTTADTDTDLFVKIMAGLHRWMRLWKTENRTSQYIPHPATWINQRQWEDACTVPAPRPTLTRQTQGMIEATADFLQHEETP